MRQISQICKLIKKHTCINIFINSSVNATTRTEPECTEGHSYSAYAWSGAHTRAHSMAKFGNRTRWKETMFSVILPHLHYTGWSIYQLQLQVLVIKIPHVSLIKPNLVAWHPQHHYLKRKKHKENELTHAHAHTCARMHMHTHTDKYTHRQAHTQTSTHTDKHTHLKYFSTSLLANSLLWTF